MAHLIVALFEDSEDAGHAAGKIKGQDMADDISVVSKKGDDFDIDDTSHTIKQKVADGAVAGGLVGAGAATLAALLAGATAITIPPLGIFITGPLATALASAAAGAAVGGIVGALVDWGVPDEHAKMFEEKVKAGQTLVAVTVDHDDEDEAAQVLKDNGADRVEIYHNDM
jgi:uncharacterized membrane protein